MTRRASLQDGDPRLGKLVDLQWSGPWSWQCAAIPGEEHPDPLGVHRCRPEVPFGVHRCRPEVPFGVGA
ncbi:hypothetical protein L687_05355 [Microbacterium maritypicum MF109]|uniref:Uncharacterized protein n=1 Tax=Microbacterium maritypicum MF109 TaxID=1333857 RepID=T5KJH7_MICMQ|nr:hypothetical protein L687_05355 [Microbacterium maritypicum MF109]